MDEMEFKLTPTEFKAGDKGEYEGHFGVFGNVDEGGDRSHPGMFTKTIQENGKRVKVFYAHDWDKLIGPAPTRLEEDSRGLFAAGRLTLDSFWGKEAWALMKDGALDEGSFGYHAVKFDYDEDGTRNLREVKLYEISPVPLGMNALTSIRAVKAAFWNELKAAIPPHATEKADEDTPWDAGAVLRAVEGARQLRLIHAWVDPDGDPNAKSSYKLPHHLADGRVVWRGVMAAGNVTMGARGGAVIPQADIAGVRRHLARHYAQFEKTPPWEESAGLDVQIEALAAILENIKEGKAFITASHEQTVLVRDAFAAMLDQLNELAAKSVPPRPVDARAMALRLRQAELALAELK